MPPMTRACTLTHTQVIASIRDNIREPELLDYLDSVFYNKEVTC